MFAGEGEADCKAMSWGIEMVPRLPVPSLHSPKAIVLLVPSVMPEREMGRWVVM